MESRGMLMNILEYISSNRRKLIAALGVLVTFVTVYLLMSPASSLDKTAYCGLVDHRHSAGCYGENDELICGMDAHTHTLICYSDTSADVETEEDWVNSVAKAELTDSCRENAASVALTQLGYRESENNYAVVDEARELVNGYTRYGAVIDEPYCDWNVAFCSFVIRYSGAGAECLPDTDNAEDWMDDIKAGRYGESVEYSSAGDSVPQVGDIVFLKSDDEQSAVTAGVAVKLSAKEGAGYKVRIVSGDIGGMVAETELDPAEGEIMGFATLPELTESAKEEAARKEASAEADEEDDAADPQTAEVLKPLSGTVKMARFGASPNGYTDAEKAAAIADINSALKLSSQTYGKKTVNLSINGTLFTNTFYYDNIMKDLPVRGTTNSEKAASYADYLATLYLDAGGGTAGIEAAKKVWDRYLLDIFDPNQATPSKGTYGDEILYWTKESTGSSFHAGSTGSTTSSGLAAGIAPLDYEALKNGIDYSAFMGDLHKSVTADAAGDANSERTYNVKIGAEAQAKGKGPVAMIIQIQTAWQLFDLTHANAPKGGYAKYGATSHNEEMANLYDIKKGLLMFADYMEEHYKGNNLVLGINEIRHGGSDSMFYSSSVGGAACYVTNDAAKIKEGILGFDSFGNCEHVHYDTNTISATCKNLNKNLTALTRDVPLSNDDISKCVVIIGGTTEASSGTGGYGCVVPWSTMSSSGINSVYAIKTNSAEQSDVLDPSYYPSWLDYPANNSGAPYNGTGTNFTAKYRALTPEEVCRYLIQIAEQEMASKSINIDADTSAEDVRLADTVQAEFEIDKTKSIRLNILDNKTDTPVAAECREFIWTDSETDDEGNVTKAAGWYDAATGEPAYDPDTGYGLVIKENPDGTTTVTYDIESVHNGRKCELDFGLIAKSDYIGSNNVKSNVGTPELTYAYNDSEGNPIRVPVETEDTPEVNVPIRYNVADGGSANVDLGTMVDLASLGSEDIVADAHSKLEKYGQISGTLTYVWEMPDGSKVPVPLTVEVKDGKIQGDFADNEIPGDNLPTAEELSQMLEALQQGTSTAKLHVIFTPTPATDNGNFSDATTAAGVSKRDLPGKVTINVPITPEKKDLVIQKIWDPEVPVDASGNLLYRSVTLRVKGTLQDGTAVGYIKVDASGRGSLDRNPVDLTLTQSDETSSGSNIWQREIKGAPGLQNNKPVIYTVEEVPVPTGYVADYSAETVIKSVPGWQCEANLKLKFRDNSEKSKSGMTIVVEYKADSTGQTYTYTLNDVMTKGDGNTVPSPLVIKNLPLKASTETTATADKYTVLGVYRADGSGNQVKVNADATIDTNSIRTYKELYDYPLEIKVTNTDKNKKNKPVNCYVQVEYSIGGKAQTPWRSELIASAETGDVLNFTMKDIPSESDNITVTKVSFVKRENNGNYTVINNNNTATATLGTPTGQGPARYDYLGITTLKTTNKESIATVRIEKIVQERLEGVNENTEFEFRASMKDSSGDSANPLSFSDTSIPADNIHDLQFSAGGSTATFSLKSTESIELKVPLGFYLEVEELNAAGYYPLIKEYKKDGVYDDKAELKIIKPEGTRITVYNKCGYELPNTGGLGPRSYTIVGLILMMTALLCWFSLRVRPERRSDRY